MGTPHTDFKIICSGSVKMSLIFRIEISLNLLIALGSMVILIIFFLLIQEPVISFHLFVLSSVSFIIVL